ncbi:MAG TPA: EAL domain-containing protein [Burkholderiales bacterium]
MTTRHQALRPAAVAVALLIGAVLAAVGYALFAERQQLLADAEDAARSLVRVADEHAYGSVNATNVTLASIARALPLLPGHAEARNRDIHAFLRANLRNLPFVRAIWMLDADGNMIHDSDDLPGSFNLADRHYFQVHRDQPALGLNLDPPIRGVTGLWFVPASRRIDAPGGRFAGVVVAAMEPRYFERFYESILAGRQSVLALTQPDGTQIARVPLAEEQRGRPLQPRPAFLDLLQKAPAGTFRTASRVDGVERIYAYRAVRDRPLVVFAGVSTDEALAGWRRTALAVALASLACVAVIAWLGLLVHRELRRRDALNEALRDSEARYRRIAEYSPDPILIHCENRIVLVNQALVRLLGAESAAQLIGRPATFMLPSALEPAAAERIRSLYAGESLPRAEQVYRRLDGRLVEVEISAAPTQFDGKAAAQVTVRDITERRRNDEYLHRFRAAMDISGDAVLLIERASMRYVDVNQTFCDLVGYAREEVLGMTPMDIFSADRATLERDYDALIADNSSAANRVEGRYRRKDGSFVPIETRRRALHTKDGWIIVGTARDITAQKEAGQRIMRLNRVHAVLSGINAAIVRIRDRAELFDEACRIAVEAGGFSMVWIGVVDRAAMRIEPVAWRGPEIAVGLLRGARFPLQPDDPETGGFVPQSVRQKHIEVVDDAWSDARIRRKENMRALNVRSAASLPLLVGDEAEGVLVLHSPEPGFFDDAEIKLLLELAGDIAFALDHIEKSEKVDYLAYYDELTGLANRRLFLERLGQCLHSAGQAGEKVALAVIDVERLRIINESLGRHAGDALLKALAGRLAAGVDRAELARTSADHFAVVMQGVKGKSAVRRRIERLWQDSFGMPYGVEDSELRVAARAGIALFPGNGVDAESLLRSAEAALRRAKRTGERHVFHSAEMTEQSSEKLTLENRLHRALERDEFVLHYQPKVDVETRRIVGVEALIRWQSPELGLVPPGRFISLMEETGMILEAGAWALRRAVQDHKRWAGMGLAALRVAVNVSAVQLRKNDYVAALAAALAQGAVPPGIDLEITESLVMDDIQGNIGKLEEVRALGVNVAIDDFGTGYSSLGYLARLPVQALKIDRSFIITMLAKPDTMTLVSTIISLAHSLKLKVIAEGVDDEEQAKYLRLLRCDEMQGYLFAKPLPFDELTALLRK